MWVYIYYRYVYSIHKYNQTQALDASRHQITVLVVCGIKIGGCERKRLLWFELYGCQRNIILHMYIILCVVSAREVTYLHHIHSTHTLYGEKSVICSIPMCIIYGFRTYAPYRISIFGRIWN